MARDLGTRTGRNRRSGKNQVGQAGRHLWVIDPGFFEGHGHHFALARLLLRTRFAQGALTSFLGNLRLDPVIAAQHRVLPVFDTAPYGVSDDADAVRQADQAQNLDCSAVLARHLSPRLQAGDLLLAHTVTWRQLDGLLAWYEGLKPERPPLSVLMIFGPDYLVRPPGHDAVRAVYRRILSRQAGAGPGLRLFADSEQLAASLRELGAVVAGIAPIPVDFGLLAPAGLTPPPRVPRFVFAGGARMEKGFDLLPGALNQLALAGHSAARFSLQTTHGDPAVVAALAASPLVDWTTDDLLDEQAYGALIQSGDVVLIPYWPAAYHLRTSHILMEALGLERPVIACGTGWMESEIKAVAPGAAVFMPEWSSAGLGQALTQACRDWPALLAAAGAAGPAARARYGAARFLATLFPGEDA